MSYGGTRCKRKPENRSRCKQLENAAVQRETQDQDDELLALASIYDSDLFHVEPGRYCGHFFALVELPEPFSVVGLEEMSASKKGDEMLMECQVEYLPPITLKFRLPPDYPSKSKPQFQLTCKWLSKRQLADLCRHLDFLWSETKGQVILFSWTGFLTDCLSHLGIENKLDLSWAVKLHPQRGKENVATKVENGQPKCFDQKPESNGECAGGTDERVESSTLKTPKNVLFKIREPGEPRAVSDTGNPAHLLAALVEYNHNQIEKKFLTSVFQCKVCIEQKIGADCMRLKPCDHIYCKSCMKEYFEVQIKEGNVNRLSCPEDKCSSQAIPSQVRELVGSELFAKYDNLLLTTTLDAMSDVAYCPRLSCQCAILMETGSTIGSCPACFFVFCIYCRMAYHGVEPCRLKSEEFRRLYESYVNGTKEAKVMLEARYGKVQIRHLVESTLSEGWMEENSKECPHCKAHIEKIDGCNKMTCWKCGKFFCWRCMAKLDPSEPYSHFDVPGTNCYALLFAGNFPQEEEENEEFAWENVEGGEVGQFL